MTSEYRGGNSRLLAKSLDELGRTSSRSRLARRSPVR